MQLSPCFSLHLLSAAFLGGLGGYCWFHRTVPVTVSIAQVMLLYAGLALDYAFDLSGFTDIARFVTYNLPNGKALNFGTVSQCKEAL